MISRYAKRLKGLFVTHVVGIRYWVIGAGCRCGRLGNAVEQKFSTFRAKVDGKEMTDAEVRKVLKTSKISDRRKEVYEAAKEVGKLVAPELGELDLVPMNMSPSVAAMIDSIRNEG